MELFKIIEVVVVVNISASGARARARARTSPKRVRTRPRCGGSAPPGGAAGTSAGGYPRRGRGGTAGTWNTWKKGSRTRAGSASSVHPS